MKKEDFMFVIGYNNQTALVDRKMKNRYHSWSCKRLLDKGLFKPAFSKALYEENEEDLKAVLDCYNELSEQKYQSVEQLKRLFGVFEVKDIDKVVYL